MGEAGGSILGMADGDFLEILDAPQHTVLADRAQIEGGDAERLRPDLAVPGIEAPEKHVGRSIRQMPGLDGIEIVNEKDEHIAVWRIESRRVLGNIGVGVSAEIADVLGSYFSGQFTRS
jgi:hypothetical protein